VKVAVVANPKALSYSQGDNCTKCNDSRHKLKQVDVGIGDLAIIANVLEELRGTERVLTDIRQKESHAIPMLGACVHIQHVIRLGGLTVHSVDCIFLWKVT
jgi:hypothetical protein